MLDISFWNRVASDYNGGNSYLICNESPLFNLRWKSHRELIQSEAREFLREFREYSEWSISEYHLFMLNSGIFTPGYFIMAREIRERFLDYQIKKCQNEFTETLSDSLII